MSDNCQHEMYNNKPCNEKVFIDDDGMKDPEDLCIFHSNQIEKKKNRFDKEFRKKFNKYDEDPKKDYDFTGYVFPNSIKITEFRKNLKRVSFSGLHILKRILIFLYLNLKNLFHLDNVSLE